MERLDKKEIKKIELNILNDVDDFCNKNNITYYLACGTLLGAVRHKGFIPWDDDVDIMMPRPDYNRFLSTYNQEKYKILDPKEGVYSYAKVYDPNTLKFESGYDYKKIKTTGIDVDVFPLDGIVNDENIIHKIMSNAKKYDTLLRLSNQKIFLRKNPIKCINRIIPRIIGSKNIVKLAVKNASTYPYETSEHIIRVRYSPNGFSGALLKEVYGNPVKIQFEGYEFNAPNQYRIWLERFYGSDYMKLPSIEKRKKHVNECYRIEEK